jgi:hypothetical protein
VVTGAVMVLVSFATGVAGAVATMEVWLVLLAWAASGGELGGAGCALSQGAGSGCGVNGHGAEISTSSRGST